MKKKIISKRRNFIHSMGLAGTSILLHREVMAALSKIKSPIKLGLIADLHQDVMHDGPVRLKAFLDAMTVEKPDALLQLGDFAYPSKKNTVLTDAFAKSHPKALHVLGNHEIDGGHSFDQIAKLWGMKGRYYTENINGLDLIVLDANEKPKGHKRGYPAYVGQKQLEWLEKQLKMLKGPILVVSHQPLAGPGYVENAREVQTLLNAASEKVLLAVNGHTHIDHLVRVGKLFYLHVNSASYKWVGGSHRNKSYPPEVHSKFRWIEYTCPYRDSLFATLTVDPAKGLIQLKGRESQWVGKSPSQLGTPTKYGLTNGKEICPKIRNRQLSTTEK